MGGLQVFMGGEGAPCRTLCAPPECELVRVDAVTAMATAVISLWFLISFSVLTLWLPHSCWQLPIVRHPNVGVVMTMFAGL